MTARRDRPYLVLVLLVFAGAVALRLADPFFVQALRFIAFDSYQRLAPESYDAALPVAIVDIDEESLTQIGQWPWSRTVMADLLDRLADAGAAVVAFDILFAEAERPGREADGSGDQAFADAIGRNTVVLSTALGSRPSPPPPAKAGFAVAGDDPRPLIAGFAGATRNLARFDAAADGIGSINWMPDRDQVIRRLPLVYRLGETFVPSFVGEALRVAQGAGSYVLKASNASGETAFGATTGLNHLRIGAIDIPTDADGGIWLKYRPARPDAYIPAWQVLAGETAGEAMRGRIVLVGTSAPGLSDLRSTPLDAAIAGVEIHAQAIEQILSGRSITRPDYALALELALIIVPGAALGFFLFRMSAGQAAFLGVATITTLFAGLWLAYRHGGLLLDPSYPALTLLILVSTATFYVYRRVEIERGEIRRAFAHYVSPTVVDEIIRHPERLELGGVVRPLTLMFCDVRNFTAISERLSPAELTRFINSLLTPLSDIILRRRGTIDKYMGDAIMAFWNAPLDDADHAANACHAAAEMVAKVEALNRQWRAEAVAAGREFVPVAIGIGVSTGECLVGNLGSDQRFDYSALGDEVNVASRLEGLAKLYHLPVVLGEATVAAGPGLGVIEIDFLRVKGRSRPTRVYTLAGILGGDVARLKPLHEAVIRALGERDWPAAEAAITACREAGISRLEILYGIYETRMAAWRAQPPPDDWDGAVAAEMK